MSGNYKIYDYYFTEALENDPDSIPLRFTYAKLLHYFRGKIDEEYAELKKLKESPGISKTVEEWISGRLYYLDLYINYDSPGFWTKEKIEKEANGIASSIETDWDITAWFKSYNKNKEYPLMETLARLFMKREGLLTENGITTTGAEYMKANDYLHITELSKVMKALKEFTEALIARDVEKILEYIKDPVNFYYSTTGDYGLVEKGEFIDTLNEIFDYSDKSIYDNTEYTIDGFDLEMPITFARSDSQYEYVSMKCQFEYQDNRIILTGVMNIYKPDESDDWFDSMYGQDIY